MKDAKGHGSDPRGTPHGNYFSGGAPRSRAPLSNKFAPKSAAANPGPHPPLTYVPGSRYNGPHSARGETVRNRQTADESRNPTSTVTDRMAAMTLAQGHPKSNEVPLGSSFTAAKSALARGRSVALPRGAEDRRKS